MKQIEPYESVQQKKSDHPNLTQTTHRKLAIMLADE